MNILETYYKFIGLIENPNCKSKPKVINLTMKNLFNSSPLLSNVDALHLEIKPTNNLKIIHNNFILQLEPNIAKFY